MPYEPEPPPKKLTFKAAEFERVNEPAVSPSPEELTLVIKSSPATQPDEDPMELLRLNREHEKATGSVYDQSPAPVFKRSQRNREYLVMLAGGNLLMGVVLLINPGLIIFMLPGMLVFSASLTWVMLFIFEDY